MLVTIPSDPLIQFGRELDALPSRHVRRIGLFLTQFGLLITAATFCVSIVAMNIGLVAGLVGCVLAQAPIHRLVGAKPLMGLLLTLAISTGWHQEWRAFIATAIIPVGLLTAQVALHAAVPGAARLRRFIAVALIAAVGAAVLLALGQFFIGRGKNRPFRIDSAAMPFSRTSGFFGLHLTQGGVMGMLAFLLTALTYDLKKPWPWLPSILAAVGVILSGARAASLGLALAITAFFALRGRRFILFGVLAGTVFVVCGLTLLHLTDPHRFRNLIHLQDGRWPIWKTSLVIVADHPLIGTGGSDSFREAFRVTYPSVVPDIPPEFPKGASHAHNTQLAHAAEHGIPFALAWLFLLGVVWLHLWRRRHDHPVPFQCGTALIVMTLTFGQFEKLDGECSRVLWTGCGLLLALLSHPRSHASTTGSVESSDP